MSGKYGFVFVLMNNMYKDTVSKIAKKETFWTLNAPKSDNISEFKIIKAKNTI